MKKTLMIAATLMMGGAAFAQSDMSGAGESLNSTRADGYPPCSRAVTDRCIQLYERGVGTSANLAMNDRTGAAAVGGPYEPVTTHSSSSMTHGVAGVGGPIEQRDGYPPCRHSGPGEDSCIQLYERGVTGAGN